MIRAEVFQASFLRSFFRVEPVPESILLRPDFRLARRLNMSFVINNGLPGPTNQIQREMKMKTQIKNLIAAIVATCVLGSVGFAQQPQSVLEQQAGQAQAFVQPQIQVQPHVAPIQQNPFYFGMNVELKRDRWGRTTLRIVGVTQGSPAQQAGLEFGDEIRRVNGRGFRVAINSFDAVRMVNQFVTGPVFGGPAPAAQALTISPYPSPRPIARMVVRNVRTGQDVIVKVFPTRVGYGGGAPAVAAAAVTAGG